MKTLMGGDVSRKRELGRYVGLYIACALRRNMRDVWVSQCITAFIDNCRKYVILTTSASHLILRSK